MWVLLTGAGGPFGLDLVDAYDDHDVLGLTRQDLDISSEAATDEVVERIWPGPRGHGAAVGS